MEEFAYSMGRNAEHAVTRDAQNGQPVKEFVGVIEWDPNFAK